MVMKFAWRVLAVPTVLLTTILFVFVVCQIVHNSDAEEALTLLDRSKTSSPVLNSTVHLVMVVENTTSTVTLVKSILMHRHSPIHFHFVVASELYRVILVTLMNSWELPKFGFSVYSVSGYTKNTSWLPNESYFDFVNDVIKLHLPSVLPVTLNRVILLDTNLVATGDIRKVWSYFLNSELRERPLAVSATYSRSRPDFDGSMIFYNLDVLRSIKWRRVWHRGAVKGKPSSQMASTAIMNKIITEFPSIHCFLPCSWIESCRTGINCNGTGSSYFIKLEHWKSAMCSDLEIQKSKYHLLESNVNKYDSVSLKSYYKKSISPIKRISRVRICRTLKQDANMKYLTHLFYIGGFYHPSDEYETSLVSQLSIDRVLMFQMLVNHWDGPASITMYGNDSQVWSFMQYLNQHKLTKRQNLAIHFVIKQGMFYPVNYLRNVALSNARTEYVFLDDGDFLPSYGLFAKLKKYNKHLFSSSKCALVIPAFQTTSKNMTYPANKRELLVLIESTELTTFCPTCKHQTHASTRYEEWYKSQYPYEVDWSFHYEPYVVVKKNVVQYDRRFMGYGWNKVSQITEFKAQGYQFIVIPDHFIIHMPHGETKDKIIWTMGVFKFCIDRIWKTFLTDLKKKYGKNCLDEKHGASIVFKYNYE